MINTTAHSPTRRGALLVPLIAITLIAAGLRLWRLDAIPAGLHFDEAAYGLQAQQILAGETPVFFSNYAGREALFQYTVAPFIAALGPTILAVRLPAALWSIALVPLVALLGSRLFGWRTGLLAALATACGPWLVYIGRTGFRANTLPVMSALAVYVLYRALVDQRRRDWIVSGALYGLSLYTYAVVRVLPLLGPLLLLYLVIGHRATLRRSGRGLGLFLLALLIIATPYVYHMVRVPSDWFERFQQVSLTEAQGSRAAVLLANLRLVAQMFGVRGVEDDFSRLAYRPVFVGVSSLPFYVGLIGALWRWRKLPYGLVLLWLGVTLLPIMLAADTTLHWIHAIGAAPATYLLWGLGAAWIMRLADRVLERFRTKARLRQIGGALIIVVIGGWWTQATANEYFQVWAQRPELYYDWMQYATDAALAAEQEPTDRSILISEDYYRHASYLFLAPRTREAQWYDARHAVVWPRRAPWTAFVSVSTPTTEDIAPLLVAARGTPISTNGVYAYMRLDGTTIPPFTPPTPYVARFGDVLELQGINVTGALEPNGMIRVQLYNRALQAQKRELRFFAHVEDEQNRVVAQQDALGYDAREWQPGDQFISFHDLTLPETLPAGRLRLIVGLYDAITGERFPVSGQGAQGDFLELPLP